MKLKKMPLFPFSLSKEKRNLPLVLKFGVFMSRLDNLCYFKVIRLLLIQYMLLNTLSINLQAHNRVAFVTSSEARI